MPVKLLILLSLVEAGIFVAYISERKWGLALVWACYAVANIGFILQ